MRNPAAVLRTAGAVLCVCLLSGTVLADEYLVLGDKGKPGKRFRSEMAASGASVITMLPQINMAVVASDHPGFANRLKGYTVVPNLRVGRPVTDHIAIGQALPQPPFTGDDDFFFDLQWGHTAVRAQEAWAAGQRGNGAVVAVIDEGFDLDHPDLAPNIIHNATFVPGTIDAEYLLAGSFSHGSHTAGIIAAADNAYGTIGIAPEAGLVLLKALDENVGSGSLSWIIEAIVYAADYGADVINMSLGTIIPQGIGADPRDEKDPTTAPLAPAVATLRTAVNRAITYAHQRGATVVVSAGNDGLDLNSPATASLVNFNAFASHAISVSATAPIGWAKDPGNIDLNQPTGYSNYGPETDFAAPGGNFVYPGNENCLVAGLVRPCWIFDFVFSVGSGGAWYWSIGTSMAAPHVAGLAALIIGANGGDMNPSRVKAVLRANALDLGKRGDDDIYGSGLATSGF